MPFADPTRDPMPVEWFLKRVSRLGFVWRRFLFAKNDVSIRGTRLIIVKILNRVDVFSLQMRRFVFRNLAFISWKRWNAFNGKIVNIKLNTVFVHSVLNSYWELLAKKKSRKARTFKRIDKFTLRALS